MPSKGKATAKTSGKRVAARKPEVEPRPARATPAPAPAALEPVASLVPAYDTLTFGQRENPRYLDGENLRNLGHQKGLSRSIMAGMSDEKLREELNLIAHRNAREEAAATA